jgi:mannose-6-phosphate isomerase-like protein (cupin superfamily)
MAQLPVITVENIATAAGEARHAGCTKAVLSERGAEQTAIFRLNPGGVIQTHLHSRVFDLFVGIAGCLDITYEGQQGAGVFHLKPNSFCSMPPGVRHEVRNNSTAEDGVFMLIHAPYEGYDFIPVEFHGAAGGSVSAGTPMK